MTGDAWTTLIVVLVTITLLATERLPPAVTMLAANIALLVLGVLPEEAAFAGFANPAPITIAGLYVLAGAAETTGALSNLTDRALGSGRGSTSARRNLSRVVLPTTFGSAVIANTPLIGILAPRVQNWARRSGQSPSLYLMPMSFAAVFGGVITLIGTSTNLVVSGLLESRGMDPLSLFEITPVGLPLAVLGAGLLIALSPKLLPQRASVAESLESSAREFTLEMTVSRGGKLIGLSVADAGLRHLEGVYLVAVERAGDMISPIGPDFELEGGDRLTFAGNVSKVLDLQRIGGLESSEHRHFDVLGSGPDRRIYEVAIAERSSLVGSTLKGVGFRNQFGAAVLAVHRASQRVEGKIGEVRLRPGDVLLLVADPGFAERYRDHHDFLVVSAVEGGAPLRRDKTRLVEAAVLFLVITSATGLLSLMEASLITASALVLLRVLSPTEARNAINLDIIVIMAASISIGTAVADSGLATEIGQLVVDNGQDLLGDLGILAAILLATMVMTELLSNNAAAALMLPIGLASASSAGLDPRPFAIAVLIGASCSFLTPIGYQTNTMVYGMGGYRFADFSRLGAPLTLLTFVVSLALIPVAFPLNG
jgi:di/tricarboxylate transporter